MTQTIERTSEYTQIDLENLSALEIIERGLATERQEVIPLANIMTEHALIDEEHAKDLGASMKQKRGQIMAIGVRARTVIDEAGTKRVVYDVIDGFHRTEGKRKNGDKDIKATVVYGCGDEELMDLRILAVSSVKSIQFPRIAEWINGSFATSEFAAMGLSATQAFAIVNNDVRRPQGIRMTPDQVDRLNIWVKGKCETWRKSVGSTLNILKIVEDADPTLVSQVREKGGGKDRTGAITPTRLKTVVTLFPGKENYPVQRAVLKLVVDRRYYAEETDRFVTQISDLLQPGMSEEQIYNLISQIELSEPTKELKDKKSGRAIPTDTEEEEGDLWDSLEGPAEYELDELDQELHGQGERRNGHATSRNGTTSKPSLA